MRKKQIITVLGLMIVLILLVSCNLPTSNTVEIPNTGQQDPTPTNTLEPLPTPTDTAPLDPTDTAEAIPTNPPEPTATTGPQCTVLQALNLRSGPGTAYNPPIRALEAQTVLVPQGYNPVGIPGGPWVQVFNGSMNEIGWVSAGNQFVSCNIDLTTLPAVQVAPPPPPPPPNIDSSAPEGSFPPNLIFEEDFNPQYFFRLWAYDDDFEEKRDGVGIDHVIFEVTDENGNIVYETSEHQAAFCIFGGDGPCNPWVFEDYVYKWEPGGKFVEDGNYQFEVRTFMESGQKANLRYQIVLKLN